ncbi:hypothetical protein [Streptomyces sp. SPB074]|uniref:hypothetical protein n=1 Tax=Streptomyces sp. (strain SPB074) TaxID=465543 RepID=UPI00055EE175|nr:hypothetical protein [Streptomyces sp. SPB074]
MAGVAAWSSAPDTAPSARPDRTASPADGAGPGDPSGFPQCEGPAGALPPECVVDAAFGEVTEGVPAD